RVGGRTVSTEVPAANGVDRWDFGGQWVGRIQTSDHVFNHKKGLASLSAPKHTSLELIKELGLETFPQFNVGKKVYHMGGPGAKVRTYRTSIPTLSPVVLMDLTQFLWKIDRLCSTVCVHDPLRTPNAVELDSMTLHSYTEQHAWTTNLKEEMGICSRSIFGMEPSQMSFLFFLMYAAAAGGVLPLLESTPGSAQELKIKGGTQQLSECLAERVGWKNVRLGSAVTAIWQDAEWARVTTATASFLCRAVIVTCPPHLAGQVCKGLKLNLKLWAYSGPVCTKLATDLSLKASYSEPWTMARILNETAKIHYQPALPSQREFLTQNMPVGHMIKFIITYQTAFWKEKGFSGEIVTGPLSDCPFCVTFDATSPSGNAALVGFIAGHQASQWSSKEGGGRKKAVLSSLVKYLGPEATSFIHYEEKGNYPRRILCLIGQHLAASSKAVPSWALMDGRHISKPGT
ncbi:hypothetical protein L3Q82_012358, partial [Scortum barcoo]